MVQSEEERCAKSRRFQAIDGAFRAGNLAALRMALDDPPDFPNCQLPFELGMGDCVLIYAIGWSPISFLMRLLILGADPNPVAQEGFPPLISVLSTERPDRQAMLKLLLDHGVDPNQRGINDWTSLHFAVARHDLAAVKLLLAHGADPCLRTRIDECRTPLEDARAAGFAAAADVLESSVGWTD